MTAKEFEIHVYIKHSEDPKGRKLLTFCNLVFQSSKCCVDSIGVGGNVCEIYGRGKHSDAVRVYSALRNNKYNIIHTEGV